MMALDLVTTAILERLKAALAAQSSAGAASFNVALAAPDGNSAADLLLFLYQLSPDPDLRNAERHRPHPAPGDAPRRFEPAVPLELRFLVTLGAAEGSAGSAGLARLASAIRAIESGSPLVVPQAFQAAIWLSLLPMTSDELSRIWGLFPNENCRTSFAFRAAPVWIDPLAPALVATPVSDDSLQSNRLEDQVQ